MATTNIDTIQALYVAYFNRPADPAGLAYWLNVLSTGAGDAGTISAAFSQSTEYQAAYAGLNTDNVVNTIYKNLFGHTADTPGLNYWVNLLTSGQVTLANAVAAIAGGAQGTDLVAFNDKVAVSEQFTTALNDNVDARLAYTGDAANAIAKSFLSTVTDSASATAAIAALPTTLNQVINAGNSATSILTTGTDQATGTHIIGSLSTYNSDGKGPTLTVGDTVTGSGTDNTLTLADAYNFGNDIIPAGVSIKNIQHVELQTAGNAGGSSGSFDVSGIAGIKTVTVTSAGNSSDVVVANGTTDVTVTHGNIFNGDTKVVGGQNVTVVSSAGGVLVGTTNLGATPLANQVATGAVSVTEHGTGNGSINIVGGTTVSVTIDQAVNSGDIQIGNTSANTGDTSSAATNKSNATGAITVNEAGTGNMTVFGGSSVTVTDTALTGAGSITIGDFDGHFASNQATGAITVTETAQTAYAYKSSQTLAGDISIAGGTDVSVTTNAGGSIFIGGGSDANGKVTDPSGNVTVVSTGLSNGDTGYIGIASGHNVTVTAANSNIAIGSAYIADNSDDGLAAHNPVGNIVVTETAGGSIDENSSIYIDGGADITVTAQGQEIEIGEVVVATGNVTVTNSGVLTGGDEGSAIGDGNGFIYVGGGVNITINTTGGDVEVGEEDGYGGAVTGAVVINDTFSGTGVNNEEYIDVYGGTTVNVTVGASSESITVGQLNGLNTDGVTLKNVERLATGDVTIYDAVVNTDADGNTVTTYGTAYTNVYTNGAATVTITGGEIGEIIDAQTTLATAGVNSGKPIGTSTLATVILDGAQESEGTIISNALANLTVTNSDDSAFVITNTTAAHALALTIGGNTDGLEIVDATAGSLAVTDNGVASSDDTVIDLVAIKATTISFANTADQAFNLSSDVALKTITATNTGALDLGNLTAETKLTSIDASGATGAVTASIHAATTGFTGGAGDDVITIDSNTLAKDVTGGAGNNTLVANYVAASGDAALTSNAHIKGFTTLALGASASSATTGAAYQSGRAVIVQSDTVTIGGTIALNDTFTAGGQTYTAVAGDTPASVAAKLAGLILGNSPTGVSVSYASGSASFTLTGASDGTSFTDVVSKSSAAGTATLSAHTAGQTAIVGDNFYDASGFTALTVGATAGDVTFKNVAAGATLDLTDSNLHLVNYVLQNSSGTTDKLAVTVGNEADVQQNVLAATGIETLTVNATGVASQLLVADSAASTVTVTGSGDLILAVGADNTTITGGTTNYVFASSVTKIDASAATGDVNVEFVALKEHAAHTITGGAGELTAAGGTATDDVDTITTGSGGGEIFVGQGGSWGTNSAYATGSETINLTASAAKADVIIAADGTVATYNGTQGGVTGFGVGLKTADSLAFTTSGGGTFSTPSVDAADKSILANLSVSTVVSSINDANLLANSIDPSGALFTALNDLTYTVSNGIITFSATGGRQLGDFTSRQLLSAVEIILNSTGGDLVAAFTTAGNTYVVSDDANQTLLNTGSLTGGGDNGDTLIDLIGVTGITGFGKTGAAGTLVGNVDNIASTASDTGTGTSHVFNDAGFAIHNLDASIGGTVTLNNLAASAEVNVSGAGAFSLSINQIATGGNDSVSLEIGAQTLNVLTLAGDGAAFIDGFTSTITSIVDSTNTLGTLTLSGSLTVGGVTSTALTTIDATDANIVNLGTTTALAQDGLTIKLGHFTNAVIEASGAGVVITQASDDEGFVGFISTGNVTIGTSNHTNGAGDIITLSNGNNHVSVLGDGDQITVGTGNNTILASGANDIVTIHNGGSNDVTVGAGAVVNLLGSGNHETTLHIGNDVTGGSSASFAFTTVNGYDSGDVISFTGTAAPASIIALGGFSGDFGSQVNVAGATTLAQALDIAANVTALTQITGNASSGLIAGHTGVIDWFQFQGNTYVVESVNTTGTAAAHTALGAHDVVVELTGLHSVNTGHNVI